VRRLRRSRRIRRAWRRTAEVDHLFDSPAPARANGFLPIWPAIPYAGDTVERIRDWWLLQQRVGSVTAEVKEVLAEPVAGGLVLRRPAETAAFIPAVVLPLLVLSHDTLAGRSRP